VSPKADLDVLDLLKVKKVELRHNQKLLALCLCALKLPEKTERCHMKVRYLDGYLVLSLCACKCGYTVSISYLLIDLRNISVEISNPRNKDRLSLRSQLAPPRKYWKIASQQATNTSVLSFDALLRIVLTLDTTESTELKSERYRIFRGC
jgi:uncharacterized membrane protein YjgN (DUF898 family)